LITGFSVSTCYIALNIRGLKGGASFYIYRSPNQSSDQFTLFKQKWDKTLININ